MESETLISELIELELSTLFLIFFLFARYVTRTGGLSDTLDDNTMFIIEFFGGKIALKTTTGISH